MDNTDLVGGHLHVGEVIPSGEMNARPARHLLRSVFPLQLLILCSFHAFAMLERLSAARVAPNLSTLYVFSLLNGALESCVEAAAIADVLADRGGTRGFAIEEARVGGAGGWQALGRAGRLLGSLDLGHRSGICTAHHVPAHSACLGDLGWQHSRAACVHTH